MKVLALPEIDETVCLEISFPLHLVRARALWPYRRDTSPIIDQLPRLDFREKLTKEIEFRQFFLFSLFFLNDRLLFFLVILSFL